MAAILIDIKEKQTSIEGGTVMYENEIYSGDRTGDHTTGTYQSYQNPGNIPQEPEKKKQSGGFGKKMLLCACMGLFTAPAGS